MNEYTVKWIVRGSVGMPQYKGTENIYAENDEAAETAAQRKVHRAAFRDISIGRIEILSVERVCHR